MLELLVRFLLNLLSSLNARLLRALIKNFFALCILIIVLFQFFLFGELLDATQSDAIVLPILLAEPSLSLISCHGVVLFLFLGVIFLSLLISELILDVQ